MSAPKPSQVFPGGSRYQKYSVGLYYRDTHWRVVRHDGEPPSGRLNGPMRGRGLPVIEGRAEYTARLEERQARHHQEIAEAQQLLKRLPSLDVDRAGKGWLYMSDGRQQVKLAVARGSLTTEAAACSAGLHPDSGIDVHIKAAGGVPLAEMTGPLAVFARVATDYPKPLLEHEGINRGFTAVRAFIEETRRALADTEQELEWLAGGAIPRASA